MESRYTAHIFWDPVDEDYVARCTEFPGLSAAGESKAEALQHLEDAIEMALDMAEETESPVPEPISIPEYSGNIRLRLPRSLHKTLAETAEAEGISLNQYMVSLLSMNSVRHETHYHIDHIVTSGDATSGFDVPSRARIKPLFGAFEKSLSFSHGDMTAHE